MFLLKVKKVAGWAITASLLLGVLGGTSAYAADNNVSRSSVLVHKIEAGAVGNDTVKLKKPSGLSSNSCALFVSAKVKYDKKRWGEAEIKSSPSKGCNPDQKQCNVVVKWGHAPVGFVHYWVEAKWTVKSSGC